MVIARRPDDEQSQERPEALLVTAAQAGDQAAFAELVRRHSQTIHNLILNIVRSTDDALDVTQDVWLRVARKLPQLQAPDRFQPWLYRIARNCALDVYNAKKARRSTSIDRDEDGDHAFELPDTSPGGPEANVESLDERRKVWEALGDLSEDDRGILFLRDLQELSYEEIGGVLGITRGAAQVRVFRARERFRKQFARVEVATHACNVSPLDLSALIDHEGGSAARIMLQRHTASCADCTARLRAMHTGRELYRRLGMFVLPAGSITGVLSQGQSILAASVIAAGTTTAAASAGATAASPVAAAGLTALINTVAALATKVAAPTAAGILLAGVALEAPAEHAAAASLAPAITITATEAAREAAPSVSLQPARQTGLPASIPESSPLPPVPAAPLPEPAHDESAVPASTGVSAPATAAGQTSSASTPPPSSSVPQSEGSIQPPKDQDKTGTRSVAARSERTDLAQATHPGKKPDAHESKHPLADHTSKAHGNGNPASDKGEGSKNAHAEKITSASTASSVAVNSPGNSASNSSNGGNNGSGSNGGNGGSSASSGSGGNGGSGSNGGSASGGNNGNGASSGNNGSGASGGNNGNGASSGKGKGGH